MLASEYILRKYQGRYYGKCQNLSRVLWPVYDSALAKHNLLPNARPRRCEQRPFEPV
jgi:amidase